MRRGSIGRRITGKRFPTATHSQPGLGTYVCDLPTERLTAEDIVRFAIFWPRQNRWEGTDFQVEIANALDGKHRKLNQMEYRS